MFVENSSTRWTMVIHLLAFVVVIGAEFIDDKSTGLVIASIAAGLMVLSNIYLNKDLNRTGDRAKQHDQHIIDLKWLTNALGKLVTQKSNKLAASDPVDIDNMRTDSIKDLLSNIGGFFNHTNYDYHAEFLKQFAIRIVMEISALKRHQP